jgi:fructan beta-fructosidase
MKFNQMMGLPVELTLHSTGAGGTTIKVQPVRELTSLRKRMHTIKPQRLGAGANPLDGIQGELFEIEAVLNVGDVGEIKFDLRGVAVVYHAATQELSCLGRRTRVVPKEGRISLRLFVDRCAVDIFGDDGRLYLPMAMQMSPENHALKLTSHGGYTEIIAMKVHELRSAW